VKRLALAIFSAASIWPAAAHATAGEHEWSAGAALGSSAPGISAGVEGGGLYDLSDFWAIGASLRDRRSFYDLPRGATALAADVRFALDALTFVPAVSASGGAAWTANGFKPFVRADVSLGYRPARAWGVAAYLGAEQESLSNANLRWTLGVRFVWYRGAGIGLDL